MGIKDFKKIFPVQGMLSLKQLKGLTLAVDAMGEIYRGILGTAKVDLLTDKNGNPTNYISVLLAVIKNFYINDIKQIWIFDNPLPNKHKLVLYDRKVIRDKAQQKLDAMVDNNNSDSDDNNDSDSDSKKEEEDPLFAIPKGYVDMNFDNTNSNKKSSLEKQAFTITSEMIINVQNILNYFNIPYIIAPQDIEAEHVAADLTQKGIVDAVFTNDLDALVFGATRVILRNRTKGKKSKYAEFMDYHLNILLSENKLTHEQLAKVAIVMGCDFYQDKPTPGEEDDDPRPYFKGIGPKTIIEKLPYLEKRGFFLKPLISVALGVFMGKVPDYVIINEEALSNKKGARSFRSSKEINIMVKWLVEELGFDSKTLVTRFRDTYGLDKIKYKAPSRKHPNDPAAGKKLQYSDMFEG